MKLNILEIMKRRNEAPQFTLPHNGWDNGVQYVNLSKELKGKAVSVMPAVGSAMAYFACGITAKKEGERVKLTCKQTPQVDIGINVYGGKA